MHFPLYQCKLRQSLERRVHALARLVMLRVNKEDMKLGRNTESTIYYESTLDQSNMQIYISQPDNWINWSTKRSTVHIIFRISFNFR